MHNTTSPACQVCRITCENRDSTSNETAADPNVPVSQRHVHPMLLLVRPAEAHIENVSIDAVMAAFRRISSLDSMILAA